MLFIVVTGPTYEKAQETIRQGAEIADGFELRLDHFERIDLEKIRSLMQQSKSQFLFTLRKQSQGGAFQGSEEERYKVIRELLTLKPHFFDLEDEVDPSFADFSQTKLLISHHNFTETPQDLEALLQKMQQRKGFAYKIAVKAASSLDALRMLSFIRRKQQEGTRIIGLSMGEEGSFSRILGPVVGNLIDYAPLELEGASAPGQLTAQQLCDTFRYKNLKESTAIYALLGDPVSASASHLTHNRIFTHFQADAVYVKIRVKPEELAPFFSLIKELPFKGFSVTMPLKEAILPYLTPIAPDAKAIGSVNTIVISQGTLTGYNTDGRGALDAIEAKQKVAGKKMLILGAGGTARAIAFEAKERGATLFVVNRTKERALELAASLKTTGYGFEDLSEICKEGYDILVNTTSVGMSSKGSELPLPPQAILPGCIVMDAIFNPKKTPLLQEAEKKGCSLVYGYEMWINQAVLQFALWFGEQFNAQEMKRILQEGYTETT